MNQRGSDESKDKPVRRDDHKQSCDHQQSSLANFAGGTNRIVFALMAMIGKVNSFANHAFSASILLPNGTAESTTIIRICPATTSLPFLFIGDKYLCVTAIESNPNVYLTVAHAPLFGLCGVFLSCYC